MKDKSRFAPKRAEPGQAMVEFVLAFMIFILSVIGVFDIARLVFDEHGLTRAGESIAHTLAEDYATIPNFGYSTALEGKDVSGLELAISKAIVAAHAQSDLGLDPVVTPQSLPMGTPYEVFSNSTISVCASPAFINGVHSIPPNVIKVTIHDNFNATLGISLGGRTIHLSQTSTALTYVGEQSAGTYATPCP